MLICCLYEANFRITIIDVSQNTLFKDKCLEMLLKYLDY